MQLQRQTHDFMFFGVIVFITTLSLLRHEQQRCRAVKRRTQLALFQQNENDRLCAVTKKKKE